MNRFVPRGAVSARDIRGSAFGTRSRDLRSIQDSFATITHGHLRPQNGINIPVPMQMFVQPPPPPHYYQPPPHPHHSDLNSATAATARNHNGLEAVNMFSSQQSQDPIFMQQIGEISSRSQFYLQSIFGSHILVFQILPFQVCRKIYQIGHSLKRSTVHVKEVFRIAR